MFKEQEEGQTHYYGDNCGEPAHNQSMNNLLQKEIEAFEKEFGSIHPDRPMPSGLETETKITDFLRQSLLRFTRSVVKEAMPEEGIKWMQEGHKQKILYKL